MSQSTRKPLSVQVGEKFGKLEIREVIQRADGKYRTRFRIRCECGTEKEVDGWDFLDKGRTSCGCDRRGNRHRHGYTAGKLRPEWQAWNHMLQRCYNPNDRHYADYGGRGIAVCEQWRGSFEAFLEHMGDRPEGGFSLDRFPNADGNYEPGNCRWATAQQQAQNRRTVIWLEWNGIRDCVAGWSRRLGIERRTIQARYHRGESVEDVLRPVVRQAV